MRKKIYFDAGSRTRIYSGQTSLKANDAEPLHHVEQLLDKMTGNQ